MRRDGFVSAAQESDSKPALIKTKPMLIDKPYFYINTDATDGDVVITFLPESDSSSNNNPISFSISNVDSTKIKIADLSEISGFNFSDRYIIEIQLVNADLYSFWFSDSAKGTSGGYTAGGGPNLSPTGIDI